MKHSDTQIAATVTASAVGTCSAPSFLLEGTVLGKGERRFVVLEATTMPGCDWRKAYRIREQGDKVKGCAVSLTPAEGLKQRFSIISLPNKADMATCGK